MNRKKMTFCFPNFPSSQIIHRYNSIQHFAAFTSSLVSYNEWSKQDIPYPVHGRLEDIPLCQFDAIKEYLLTID